MAQRKGLMTENPILDELVYDSSSGALNYKGVRYLMIRPETIAGLQRALTASGGKDVEKSFFSSISALMAGILPTGFAVRDWAR